MGCATCLKAQLQCKFGLAPATLIVLPINRVLASGSPIANIMDSKPFVNIPNFGSCTTQSNPAVAAATAAKSGVPTPAACVPVTPAPWLAGSPKVLIGNMPTLTADAQTMCTWGGVISIAFAGQVQVMA